MELAKNCRPAADGSYCDQQRSRGMSHTPHSDFNTDSGETLVRSLTEERDALRAELERCRAKLDYLRELHSDEQALLQSTESALGSSEADVDEGRTARARLRPRYERLIAQELRLRELARSHGLLG
jgi:chromosome segregation ATPase